MTTAGESGRHRSDLTGPLLGGLVASLGLFGGVILVGGVGSGEALQLIRAVVPTAQFLGSAVIGAGATVLALMLTLLALTNSSEWTFTDAHYLRVRWVTRLATVSIVLGVVILVALSVPIEEVDDLRARYAQLYYALAAGISVLGGVVVAMALMIGATVHGLIDLGRGPEGSHLVENPGHDSS